MRIPDDHIAIMCGFMAHEAERSWRSCARERGRLAASLRGQEAFVRDHTCSWADGDFARCARRSNGGALPQMIEGAGRLRPGNDVVLLSEAACWAEEVAADHGETIPGSLGALPGSPEASAFAEMSGALAALARLRPFGIEDHELAGV